MSENDADSDKNLEKIAVQLLADRIRELRVEKGYDSYEKFANNHNIHRAQFGRYEKGTNLQFVSLIRVIQAFDMTFDEFFSKGFESLGKVAGGSDKGKAPEKGSS